MCSSDLTAFHPGAMNHSHLNKVGDAKDVSLGIVAPDGREGMVSHMQQLADANIPFVFDPGQGLPMFSGEELLGFAERATYIAVNDYEGKMLEEKTGRSLEAIAKEVKALVVTLGAHGSHIHAGGKRFEVPCVKADAVVDPTGCGDAYRSGLLYGLASG